MTLPRRILIETAAQPRYRRSRIRNSILGYLRSSKDHPSAEQVHDAMKSEHPQVSFGTVYRNLNILVDQGQALRLESSRGKDRFDGDTGFHAHFHCDECGDLYDVPFSTQSLEDSMKEEAGHLITRRKIELYGVCSSCSRDS